MTPGQLTDAYLAALEASDEAGVLALFAADAIARSPLYGPVPAAGFYPALFRDTSRASLTLHGVTSGTSPAGAVGADYSSVLVRQHAGTRGGCR